MAVSLGITITQNSQSIAQCSSNITVSVYCWWSSGSYNKNSPGPAGWLRIDGVQYDFRNTFNDNRTSSGSKILFTKTLDVAHDSEGVRTVFCSAYFATGVSSGNITASNSLRLTDIPRYARVEKAADFTDEENPSITYVNYAGDAVADLQAAISVDGETPLIEYRAVEMDAQSYTFQLTEEERDKLRSATPDSNELAVTFLMRTTIGDDVGVTAFPVTMHIVDADPVVAPVITDTNAVTVAVTGDASILVALHSIANVTINAEARKGAKITSQKVAQGGLILEEDGEFLVQSADPILITVADSRGNVTTLQAPNVMVPYVDPLCSIEHTMPDGDGEMPLTITGKAYNGAIGVTENAVTVQYRNKAGYGEYGEWVTIETVSRTENNFVAKTTVMGLDYKARHTFQARVIDAIAAEGVLSAEKVFVAVPVFDWGPEDFRFNVPVSAKKITDLADPEEKTDATNKQYVDKGDEASKALANTKVSMTLLWENASPASEFAAQTIALDLSGYDSVQVEFDESWQAITSRINVGKNGGVDQIGDIYRDVAAYFYVAHRDIRVTTAGVTFGSRLYKYANGQWPGTANNSLIPFRIYGIKGIK